MDEQSIETIDLELAILVRRVTSITSKKLANLDRSAYLLLHQIITFGPAGVKVLAEKFRLDISTVSRQAASLEQKGYVYRIPDPLDGRAYSLQITESGKEVFYLHRQERYAIIMDILNDWTEVELEQFSELLKKYNLSADLYYSKEKSEQ